ncbi:reverse transcriptase domain-containing protein [Tanacetum coccineum]
MTKSSNIKVFTPFANPERQFQSRKDITPIAVNNIYESESSESESEDLSDIDIETLIQLLRELCENTFSGGKTEDAIEHLRKLLEIANLFNTPGILGNDIMLRIFPLTLTRAAKRLTAIEALESIQDKVDHSNRWHKEESDKKTSNNSFNTITEKLKILNHDMNHLREGVHKINRKPNVKFHHEEVKTNQKDNAPVMNSTYVQQKCTMKLEPPQETPKLETFSKKMKKRIMETQANEEKLLKKLDCEPGNTALVNDIRKTPEYTRNLQDNALADLGASTSEMSFSMFKRLGLGNPRSLNMVIKMADRSMQSPKGIVENVLVKIHKFVFLVDFVILDIVEDNNVPIILGRPMLATAHARIDVFGGKMLLEVGKEQVIFNANEGATPIAVSPVGDNNLFLNYETNSPFPDKSSREIWSPTKGFQDSDNDFGSRIDELVAIDDLWEDLD